MRNLEQELKLALTEREYRVLKEDFKAEEVLQTNYYFSSKLLPADEMLRVRIRKNKRTLCYKRRLTERGGVTVADERECEIDESSAEKYVSHGIAKVELLERLSVHMADDLICVGKMDTYRSKFKLKNWNIELDRNQYLGVTDYELECENKAVESLEQLKSYLTYAYGIVIKPSCPKVKRFMERLLKKK